MADQEGSKRREVDTNTSAGRKAYQTALRATDEALLRINKDQTQPLLGSTDEIVERSAVVSAMRDELVASRKRTETLNVLLSEARRNRDAESEKLERAFAEREKVLSEAFERREHELEQRMRALDERSQQRERATFAMRADFERTVEARQKELDAAKAGLDERIISFEVKEAKYQAESQEKLQINSKSFVSGMVTDLNKRENLLSKISLGWSVLGGAILVLTTALLAWVTYISVQHASVAMSWSLLTFFALKGAVLVGMAGIASRYAFLMAANYMTEGLRTADRVHAIRFGQFYVETYGVAATWDQVKETFSNWNGASAGAWGKVTASETSSVTPSDLTSAVSAVASLVKRES